MIVLTLPLHRPARRQDTHQDAHFAVHHQPDPANAPCAMIIFQPVGKASALGIVVGGHGAVERDPNGMDSAYSQRPEDTVMALGCMSPGQRLQSAVIALPPTAVFVMPAHAPHNGEGSGWGLNRPTHNQQTGEGVSLRLWFFLRRAGDVVTSREDQAILPSPSVRACCPMAMQWGGDPIGWETVAVSLAWAHWLARATKKAGAKRGNGGGG